MYLDFYQFRERPFNLTPDPRFLFYSERHREALNHMLYGVQGRKGFIQITGEVGAGKTTLSRAFLERLDDEEYTTALVLNPMLTANQLLRAILVEFGVPVPYNNRAKALERLNRFLLDELSTGRDVVLIIDEAQDLTPELLEQVRLLSNLETDQVKLLQILLIGQPELRRRLEGKDLRQLRQRITVRYHLEPLDRQEAERYIGHRLQVAGAGNPPHFSPAALRRIYRYSEGIPRLINAACDKSLLAGYADGEHEISAHHVRRAVRSLEGQAA